MPQSYVGALENRLRHGQGTYTFRGGYYKYTGDWFKGKMHGHGIFFLGDGSTYEGSFVHGEIQGHGLRRWPDGTTYTGEFFRGEMHGEGVYIASSGKKYEGSWRDNQYHGQGELVEADQSIYEGTFEHHKPHGEGKKRYADGATYEGTWAQGLYDGRGIWVGGDGSSYEGEWSHGLRHGRGKAKWPNRLEYDGAWTENIRDKMTVNLFVIRLTPEGIPDQTPLAFREELPPPEAVEGDNSSPPSPLQLFPAFRVDCLTDSTNQESIAMEESHHAIRISLFRGRPPQAPREVVDSDQDKKRRKSVVAVVDDTPPVLVGLVDPETQAKVLEWVVHSKEGVAMVPQLQIPIDVITAVGDYFLQFDSGIDPTMIPSAYFAFSILRADEFGAKKDTKKK
ncbi:hypothetical protein LEN26_019194 [Aphanomyces euteiches]|nr:hypothetical protein LEN26_019194 [Aphanomyces euteiches]KAH9114207.1 hypothetical protein AeMF1_011700 [Aphanomyces euteiches]KAH9196937.1 hypothetical protein AeNC1_001093 [Aphanomyces euteiches]